MEKKTTVYNVLQCVLFMLYFVILSTERIISLFTAFDTAFTGASALGGYMTVITVAALVFGWLYLALFARRLFAVKAEKTGDDFLHPCVAAGILLLGGMVHTEGSIPPVQFASYGCLLLAMLIHTVRSVRLNGQGLLRWFGFAYITAFSMAIPVVYETSCPLGSCALCTAFYPVECVVSILLVAVFTFMLVKFYKNDSLFSFSPILFGAAAALDAAVLGLRWHDEINMFVLIFISLTVVIGVVGKILYARSKRGQRSE